MSLYSSLYYPSAGISNEVLLYNGLLLWDQLEFISPFDGYDYYDHSDNHDLSHAKEILVKPFLPNRENKKMAHDIIIALANSDLPEWFFYEFNQQDTYSMYPQKLLPETWEELQKSKLAKKHKNSYDFVLSSSFGLTIMAILADVCAGKQKRTITDLASAYAGLTRFITKANEGTYSLQKNEALSQYEQLITLSIEAVDVKSIPLKKLINFREKEFKTGGGHYTKLRHNYLNKIDSYVKRLSSEAVHKGDQEEILRQFKSEIEDDLDSLADALETKRHEILFSKETLVAVAASAGAIIEPITAGVIGVGTLTRMGFNYVDGKRKVQREHAMSWLHVITS
jgi:hypothetical protein